jgi:CarboxypepD_reg-like domain
MKGSIFFLPVTLLILCMPLLGKAQATEPLRGRIIDSLSNQSVGFATIKFKANDKLIGGVISNADGDFQIPSEYRSLFDRVEISCIGYTTRVIPVMAIPENRVKIVKLKASTTRLAEVVISSRRELLTPLKIVKKAIQQIPDNFPMHPFSYAGYYRDYQVEDNHYVNLNEAIIEVFDKGFASSDYVDTEVGLYKYQENNDFPRDSMTSTSYDKKSKFIPGASLSSFGGNELSILRIHDAIRNYDRTTYSFVDEFSKDFIKNHFFKLAETVYLDNLALYRITFWTIPHNTGPTHEAKGEIYIEVGNYAIHKLTYTTYVRDLKKTRALYDIQVEYTRTDSLMYLNYISFNNFFEVRQKPFVVNDIVLDRDENGFVVTFNEEPEPSSASRPDNYDVRFDDKPFRIAQVSISQTNKKEIHLSLDKNQGFAFNIRDNASNLLSHITWSVKNVKDLSGRTVNKEVNKSVNQFREFFMQKLNSQDPNGITFISKQRPLKYNHQNAKASDASHYWMNSPLKKSDVTPDAN